MQKKVLHLDINLFICLRKANYREHKRNDIFSKNRKWISELLRNKAVETSYYQ